MKYNLTQQQFELLHSQINEGRATNPAVKVNREALRNLLEDFAALQRERNDNLPLEPISKAEEVA